MNKEELKKINTYLADKYGRLHDKPRFRLIWSTDEFEIRKSTFAYEYDGLDLGTVEDTRKVPKYSYAKDRYVLEEITYTRYVPAELVEQEPVSYEPLWVFWTGDAGDYQEPDLFHVDQKCYFRVYNTLKGHILTEKELIEKRDAAKAKNIAAFREKLDEAIPDTAHAIVHGEGIAMDSTKRFE